MKNSSRWKTALHESGHLVIGRALSVWNCTTTATVLEGGGGFAELPLGLSATAEAIANAAGDHAGRLPIPPPPRRRKPALPKGQTAEAIRGRASRESTEAAHKATLKSCIGGGLDEERIARYCVSFESSNPQDWLFRFQHVHSEAKRLVEIHAAEIHKAAIRLFHTGSVTISGDPDHDSFFTPQPKNLTTEEIRP